MGFQKLKQGPSPATHYVICGKFFYLSKLGCDMEDYTRDQPSLMGRCKDQMRLSMACKYKVLLLVLS